MMSWNTLNSIHLVTGLELNLNHADKLHVIRCICSYKELAWRRCEHAMANAGVSAVPAVRICRRAGEGYRLIVPLISPAAKSFAF